MLKSMTGFGKADCLLPDKKVTIEIKSLNSKQIDTNTRLPAIYKEKELEIRQLLSRELERGKIECNFHYELLEGAGASVNTGIIKDYIQQLEEITREYHVQPAELLSTVMRLPDTISTNKAVLVDEEWKQVKDSLMAAVDEVNEFRVQEGAALEKDLKECIRIIQDKQEDIQPFEQERIAKLREKFSKILEELKLSEDADQNRFEQELLFYLEKLDINEEKVRLKNHLEYFSEILEKGSPNGKKLGFISQEIGREINTLGSKANHSEIQRIVVEMKDELERIKEQLLNVL